MAEGNDAGSEEDLRAPQIFKQPAKVTDMFSSIDHSSPALDNLQGCKQNIQKSSLGSTNPLTVFEATWPPSSDLPPKSRVAAHFDPPGKMQVLRQDTSFVTPNSLHSLNMFSCIVMLSRQNSTCARASAHKHARAQNGKHSKGQEGSHDASLVH